MKKKNAPKNESGLPLPSSTDLRGRQSVRATFKLTQESINTLNVVATCLGIKQKALFDHLLEDMQSLNSIAENIEEQTFERLNRMQKTYVLSRKTMACLWEAAERFDAPRDALVEYSIQRLTPVIEEEKEKHERRKAVQKRILECTKAAEKILLESERLLGKDDPVCDRVKTMVTACRNVSQDIQEFIERGKIIEEF